jgi:hypothetical protein
MPIGAQGRPARLRPKSAICRELPRLSGPNSNRTPSACPSDGTDHRKVSICRAFQAADGTRTHDLLHGKKSLIRRGTPLFACKLRSSIPEGLESDTPRFVPMPADSPNHFRMGLGWLAAGLPGRRSTVGSTARQQQLFSCRGHRPCVAVVTKEAPPRGGSLGQEEPEAWRRDPQIRLLRPVAASAASWPRASARRSRASVAGSPPRRARGPGACRPRWRPSSGRSG